MNKLWFIFIIGFMVAIPSVYAETSEQYVVGDTIHLWAIITNSTTNQSFITNATCFATVYFPNTSVWLDDVAMPEVSYALYMNDSYKAQEPFGTYLYHINCTTENETGVGANTFIVGEIIDTNAIFITATLLMFGILSLWLSFVLVQPLVHPLRVVCWVAILTAIVYGIANGVVKAMYISGIEYVFYGLIIIEIILFLVDLLWLFRPKRER